MNVSRKITKKLLSLLLVLAIALSVLPVGVLAAENTVVTHEDGSVEVILEPEVIALPEIEEKNAIYTDEFIGSMQFETFEDLKELASRTYSSYTYASYSLATPLVIEEDITLPKNLTLRLTSVTVPAGVTLVTGESLNVDTLVVEGTFRATDYTYIRDSLSVTGTVYADYSITFSESASVVGEENIVFKQSYYKLNRSYSVTTMEQLKNAVEAAKQAGSNWEIDITYYGVENLVINESISIPDNCTFNAYNSDMTAGVLTIEENCTLELCCYGSISMPVVLAGTLKISGYNLSLYYDDGDVITVAETGNITGSGRLWIYSEELTDPALAVPGLDLTDFEVKEDTEYSRYYQLRNISGLTQLGKPTNLKWGYDYRWEWDEAAQDYIPTLAEHPGAVVYDVGSPDLGQLQFYVYREGEQKPYYQMEIHYGSTEEVEKRGVELFAVQGDPESGNYYFTLTSLGDYTQYYDSETAVSDIWSYTKPDAQVDIPTNLRWNGRYAEFDLPANMSHVGGYEIDFYYGATLNDEPRITGGTHSLDPNWNSLYLYDWPIQANGSGYYYFKIRAISNDLTVACNGEWSDFSEPIYIKDAVEELDNVIADMDALTENQIRDAVQAVGIDNLESAMLADQTNTGVIAQLSQLEEAVGGAAAVEVTNAAYDFDADKISVVGANLNTAASAAQDITLVVDKPEKQHIIDEAYDNSVAVRFNMTLDNVADTSELDVPVQITLPVPKNINPDFLVILHYHADGSYEELMMPYVFYENGQYYARFVLTGFSDFVMTQYAEAQDYCAHSYGEWTVTEDATCEKNGNKERVCDLCGDVETQTIPATGHTEVTDAAVEATCTVDGKTEGSHCSTCKKVLKEQNVIPALGHDYVDGICSHCKKDENAVSEVSRLAGDSRYETSFAIANEMKEVLGVDKFNSIILASSEGFADALAGSYLAAVKEAPIIIGKEKYKSLVCDYLNENLADGGTVYILGGTKAMPDSILSGMTVNYTPVRLAGDDRYTTNLEILEAAGVAGKDILVATGQDFADSLSASATGLPILLVNGKPGKTLSDAQKQFLASVDGNIYIIGGTSAVPETMVAQIEAASGKKTARIAGGSRYETSVKIAQQFFNGADSAVVAFAGDYPDGLCGGPLAYTVKAPLILTKDGKSEAPAYTTGNNITSGYVLGGNTLISDETVGEIF